MPAPLTVAELAAALAAIGGFETPPLIAVAVSGGPDSMALMLLADRWTRQRGGRAWGLTVDHRLRPDSAAEARAVAGWLAARDIPHAIIAWEGPKPTSGIQEAARAARYRLLSDWCQRSGVLDLLTAHHREDQAETYLIRRRAGSGIDGLAGMSAVRYLPGCRLMRPLLAVPRARLEALLAAERQPFLRDLSNLNPLFERVRLRASLDDAATDQANAAARAAAAQRALREAALDRLIGRAVALHSAGFAAIDQAALEMLDAALVEALLARVVGCIGGAHYPARRERVARLRAGLAEQPDRGRTLGGCRIVPWRGRFLVLRELQAASAPTGIAPGCSIHWDDRFVAELAPDARQGFQIGYLGQRNQIPTSPRREFRRSDLPMLVHSVLPALWDRDGLAAVPHLQFRRPDVGALPTLSFQPANPLTPAAFTVV